MVYAQITAQQRHMACHTAGSCDLRKPQNIYSFPVPDCLHLYFIDSTGSIRLASSDIGLEK